MLKIFQKLVRRSKANELMDLASSLRDEVFLTP